jgi:hypothetical protein
MVSIFQRYFCPPFVDGDFILELSQWDFIFDAEDGGNLYFKKKKLIY